MENADAQDSSQDRPQQQTREELLISMFVEGYTLQEIGDHLGISKQAVSKALKKIDERIAESIWRIGGTMKLLHIQTLDEVRVRAFEMYEQIRDSEAKYQCLGVRYLETIRRCLCDQRCILGLEYRKKHNRGCQGYMKIDPAPEAQKLKTLLSDEVRRNRKKQRKIEEREAKGEGS